MNLLLLQGMNTHDELEEKATEKEVQSGDSTSVTRLFLTVHRRTKVLLKYSLYVIPHLPRAI